MTARFETFAVVALAVFLSGERASAQAPESATSKDGVHEAVTRGDLAHPNIDYSVPYANDLRKAGATFFGWWGLIDDDLELTESNDLLAVNFSAYQDPEDPDAAVLLALCSAGTLYLGYFPRELSPETMRAVTASKADSSGDGADGTPEDASQWVADNEERAGVIVTVQVDEAPAKRSVWYKTDSGNGMVIRDRFAEDIMRRLDTADAFSITLAKGQLTLSTTFLVAGSNAALNPLIELCARAPTDADPVR